jgi:signal transduction histidine kinase
VTDERNPTRELSARPIVAKWLKEQEQSVVPPWIRAIQHKTMILPSGTKTRRMESAQLIEFFDSVVAATQRGDTERLDTAIRDLVAERLGRGYGLIDFLRIADQLKNAIWQSAQGAFPNDAAQAMLTVSVLEPVFAHSAERLAWLASQAAEAQLAEELERAQYTLAKLDHTKSDFISIAAHELKTPLTIVQGYTAILASELADNTRMQNVIHGLDNGIKRLQAIIRDMIDVSLIDSKVLTLALQPTSLTEIVRLVIEDLEKDASSRHVNIKLKRFPAMVNHMYLDTHRIHQVFANLIGNAIKFTPDGGSVTVDAEIVQGQTTPILDFVQVTITDTGIGIAPDDLPHIFDKFYRVGETELHSTGKTKFKGGGPGLGLVIAKGIIEAHQGRIWAESPGYDEEKCPGSKFHVMLPIYKELPEYSRRLQELEKQ